ncbi:MAG: alkaline phosphatase [Bacteroidales bacterium]
METIIETLVKDGLATGLVTTSTIVHATPAAFYAHQIDRLSMKILPLNLLQVASISLPEEVKTILTSDRMELI